MARKRKDEGKNPEKSITSGIKATDPWDLVENSGGGGYDGKNPFYLQNGDSVIIYIIGDDDKPNVFRAHNVNRISTSGKAFFNKEQCLKAHGEECPFCSYNEANPKGAVGKAVTAFYFDICTDGDTLTPELFIAPNYLAKKLHNIKTELGDKLNTIGLKLSKDGKYDVSVAMERTAHGRRQDIEAPIEASTLVPITLEEAVPLLSVEEVEDILTNSLGAPSKY